MDFTLIEHILRLISTLAGLLNTYLRNRDKSAARRKDETHEDQRIKELKKALIEKDEIIAAAKKKDKKRKKLH